MRHVHSSPFRSFACIVLLAAGSCDRGGSTAASTPAPATAALTCEVADAAGRPLGGVSVRNPSAGTAATTDGAGVARLDVRSAAETVVVFERDGYADQFRVLELPAGARRSALAVVMVERGVRQPLAAVENGAAAGGGAGARVVLPPGALVDGDGRAVTGEVEVTITPLDVATNVAAFPGAFVGIADGGARTDIVSWGTTEFVFRQAGRELDLAPGAAAEIELPLFVPTHQDGSRVAVGQQLPLWSLDEDTGLWRQEGQGTIVAAADSPTGLAMRASVAHFSWWNVDQAVALGQGNPPFTAFVRCLLEGEAGGAPAQLPAGVVAQVTIVVGNPAQPQATATTSIGAAGEPNLVPAGVPVLLRALAAFARADGAQVRASGTLQGVFEPGGSGDVTIVMNTTTVAPPRIVTPAQTIAVDGQAPVFVQVVVDGPLPDRVEVTANGALVGTFPPQFFYTLQLDVAALPEGTVEVVAAAVDNQVAAASEPRLVVIDRTPPQLQQITPPAGAEVTGQPLFELVFDEAVTAAPFLLREAVVLSVTPVGGNTPQPLPSTATLDASARVLRVQADAPLPLGVAALSWGGLRDVAGNPVAGAVAATWPVARTRQTPALEHVGATIVDAVTSPAGVVHVAHVKAGAQLAVSAFDASSGAWIELPGPIHDGSADTDDPAAIACDSANAPIVALEQTVGGVRSVVVRRWNGAAWQAVGDPFAIAGPAPVRIDLAVDGLDRPVLALTRSLALEVHRFDPIGGDFVVLDAPFFASSQLVFSVDLALAANGDPVVAWAEGVIASNAQQLFARRFAAGAWQPLGGVIDSAGLAGQIGQPSVVAGDAAEVVAYAIATPNGKVLRVRRFDGAAWVDLGFADPIGAGSNNLRPGLARRAGGLVVAWGDVNSSVVRVFDGTSWQTAFRAQGATSAFVPAPQLTARDGQVWLTHQGCCSLAHAVQLLFP